jgi:cytochrome c oxidase subunit 2
MLRSCLALLMLVTLLPAAETAPTAPTVPTATQVDHYVALFNQDIYALKGPKGPVVTPISGAFDAPASDIARDVASATWFSLLVFLPFLVLPQVLLVWIIWRYRKKADGRAPATFTGNHKLELVWTAIPVLALVIVSVPMWSLLVKMEAPPADQRRDMVVEVRGKTFAWDYKYQRLGGDLPTRREDQFEIGQDVVGVQEALVLVKDRRVIINLTANDVNHAWWIPAFGVKKDAIKGRYTNVWFTPERLGFFKGQCAELCGQGHGIMLISALVVDEADFAVWAQAQRHRSDTVRVWSALSGGELDAKALGEAVDAYLKKGADPWRLFALRFWVASNAASVARKPGDLPAALPGRRAMLENLINRAGAGSPAVAN